MNNTSNWSMTPLDRGKWLYERADDPTVPLIKFQIGEKLYGLFPCSIQLYLECLVFIAAAALVACAVAVPTYYLVVKRQQQEGSNPMTRFLVAYGILVPFWVLAPGVVVTQLGMMNKAVIFSLAALTPFVSALRTTEAVHGFTPEHATRSLTSFIVYFATPLKLKFDPKLNIFVKASWNSIFSHYVRFLIFMMLAGTLQSLFWIEEGDILPPLAHPSMIEDTKWYSWSSIIDARRWRHSFLYGLLTQLHLYRGFEVLAFGIMLVSGIETELTMSNPMLEATSPSDFWGRRWNLLVHDGLKNGVFKPVRSMGGSKGAAVFAAFLISGIVHEWILKQVLFDYPVVYGGNTAFFLWQGTLVAMEATVGHWIIVQSIRKALPGYMKTVLIIAMGLPLAHWFFDPYVRSDLYRQVNPIVITIRPIDLD